MRVTNDHWQIFLEMAEKNPELITNKCNGSRGRQNMIEIWKMATTTLNSIGCGQKSVEEWRRAVTDWKSKTKAKWAKLKKEFEATGGGQNQNIKMSHLEERLLNLMGRKSVEGDVGVKEIGLLQETNSGNMLNSPEIIIDHNYYDTNESENIDSDKTLSRNKAPDSVLPSIKTTCYHKKKNEVVDEQLNQMQADTLTILQNINRNMERVAVSLEKLLARFTP